MTKKIELDQTENPTDAQKIHYHEQLQVFFKYVNTCQDFFDKKFLVFIYNLAQHWTVIIVVNPFLVFNHYVFGDKYINVHDDDFVGWCVIDSLGGGQTVVNHEYLTGTTLNHFHPQLGVHLFLNYCASFFKGRYTNTMYLHSREVMGPGIQICHEFYVKYKEPFGDYKAKLGTESFPWFDFSSPSFINQ